MVLARTRGTHAEALAANERYKFGARIAKAVGKRKNSVAGFISGDEMKDMEVEQVLTTSIVVVWAKTCWKMRK